MLGVANGGTSVGLSHADDGTVSIFTKDGVTLHKETDVLITCHGKPLLTEVRDEHGRYRIPLIQHLGQWQPQTPSKKARTVLRPGQQHLQPSFHGTSHQMDACRLRLPGAIHVALGCPSQQLFVLAALNGQKHPEVLSRLCPDTLGTPQPDPRKHTLHQTHADSLQRCALQSTPGAQSPRRHHHDIPLTRHHLH
eukprot:CCRYP_015424-RA/>CCRYP_015424-RA protein AED:0.42 eAED:0.42 QI:0/0/0/1/0/0/2/0/193